MQVKLSLVMRWKRPDGKLFKITILHFLREFGGIILRAQSYKNSMQVLFIQTIRSFISLGLQINIFHFGCYLRIEKEISLRLFFSHVTL